MSGSPDNRTQPGVGELSFGQQVPGVGKRDPSPTHPALDSQISQGMGINPIGRNSSLNPPSRLPGGSVISASGLIVPDSPQNGRDTLPSRNERAPLVVRETEPASKRASEIRQVATQVRGTSRDLRDLATSPTDFLRWHETAVLYGNDQNIGWMWDFGGTSSGELLADQLSDAVSARHAAAASSINSLRTKIESMDRQMGIMVRVAIEEFPDGLAAGMPGYRVLATFPQGEHVMDPLDSLFHADVQRAKRDAKDDPRMNTIYFEPSSGCVAAACGILYEENGGRAFSLPFLGMYEALNSLHSDLLIPGRYNMILERDGNGDPTVTQNAGNFLLTALTGGFDNETKRVRISDYWNRQGTGYGGRKDRQEDKGNGSPLSDREVNELRITLLSAGGSDLAERKDALRGLKIATLVAQDSDPGNVKILQILHEITRVQNLLEPRIR